MVGGLTETGKKRQIGAGAQKGSIVRAVAVRLMPRDEQPGLEEFMDVCSVLGGAEAQTEPRQGLGLSVQLGLKPRESS